MRATPRDRATRATKGSAAGAAGEREELYQRRAKIDIRSARLHAAKYLGGKGRREQGSELQKNVTPLIQLKTNSVTQMLAQSAWRLIP